MRFGVGFWPSVTHYLSILRDESVFRASVLANEVNYSATVPKACCEVHAQCQGPCLAHRKCSGIPAVNITSQGVVPRLPRSRMEDS